MGLSRRAEGSFRFCFLSRAHLLPKQGVEGELKPKRKEADQLPPTAITCLSLSRVSALALLAWCTHTGARPSCRHRGSLHIKQCSSRVGFGQYWKYKRSSFISVCGQTTTACVLTHVKSQGMPCLSCGTAPHQNKGKRLREEPHCKDKGGSNPKAVSGQQIQQSMALIICSLSGGSPDLRDSTQITYSLYLQYTSNAHTSPSYYSTDPLWASVSFWEKGEQILKENVASLDPTPRASGPVNLGSKPMPERAVMTTEQRGETCLKLALV